jgi:hypothetical protein
MLNVLNCSVTNAFQKFAPQKADAFTASTPVMGIEQSALMQDVFQPQPSAVANRSGDTNIITVERVIQLGKALRVDLSTSLKTPSENLIAPEMQLVNDYLTKQYPEKLKPFLDALHHSLITGLQKAKQIFDADDLAYDPKQHLIEQLEGCIERSKHKDQLSQLILQYYPLMAAYSGVYKPLAGFDVKYFEETLPTLITVLDPLLPQAQNRNRQPLPTRDWTKTTSSPWNGSHLRKTQ